MLYITEMTHNMSKHSLLTMTSIPGHIFLDVNTKYFGNPFRTNTFDHNQERHNVREPLLIVNNRYN
jgi:hypothetical protein